MSTENTIINAIMSIANELKEIHKVLRDINQTMQLNEEHENLRRAGKRIPR